VLLALGLGVAAVASRHHGANKRGH